MNNVIKSLLFSFLIAATVSVHGGERIEPKLPATVPVGDKELTVLYTEEGLPYVWNDGKQIFIQPSSSNRTCCVSPVSFPR